MQYLTSSEECFTLASVELVVRLLQYSKLRVHDVCEAVPVASKKTKSIT